MSSLEFGIRALDVALTAEFVRQRPAQSIDDQPAFDAKNDMAEEGDPTGRSDIGPYPSGGGGISFEKAGESGPSLARMDVHGPAGNPANHGLRREIVVSYLTWFARFAGQKGDERAQHVAAAPEPLARDLDNRMRPPGFAQIVEDKPWLSRPAHKGRWASIRSKGVPEGQRALLDGPWLVAIAINSRVVRSGSSARAFACAG